MCVAACPQRAVEFPGYSADEIEGRIDGLIGSTDGPLNIVFACKKSTNLPGDDCQVVRVARAATVPTAALLNTTAMGAKSASILRCTEQCSQKATGDLEGNIDYVQEILETVGDDSTRVSLMPPADAGKRLAAPDVSEPFQKSLNSAHMFGRQAVGASLLAISESAQTSIDPFSHGYSPIGTPVIDQASCTMCGT
jgi:ferredoxin